MVPVSLEREVEPIEDLEHDWHFMSRADTFEVLGSHSNGLSTTEAERRQSIHGRNKLKEPTPVHPFWKLLAQFRDPMVYLLLAAAIMAFAVKPEDIGTPIFICIALSLNGVFSYLQERKAEQAMESLKKLLVSHCIVLRDGIENRCSTEELVPGDVVWLEEGLNVPADVRLVEVHQLTINEASLTGESDVTRKQVDSVASDSLIPDQLNMAFMGTVVASGRGRGVIVRIGMNTQLGDIAAGISDVESPKTPLEVKLESLGKFLGIIAVMAAASLLLMHVTIALAESATMEELKQVVAEQFLIAVAIFVAIVPEGLPIILVITLALGMRNMSRKNAIVRRMKVVETLGSTTVICTDKTGTLTRNEMTVRAFFVNDTLYGVTGEGFDPTRGSLTKDGEAIPEWELNELRSNLGGRLAFSCSLLCQNSTVRKVEEQWRAIGDPTDSACSVFGWKIFEDTEDHRRKHPRFREFTFDRERKRMTTIHEMDGDRWVFSKGAIGPYLSRITHVIEDGKMVQIGDRHRNRIGEVNLEMASDALRVIALTARQLGRDEDIDDVELVESGLVFLGLVGIMDPPRQEVADAIALCHRAGIQVKMITGDQQMTAMAIGREIGIIDDDSEFLSGRELERMSDEQLRDRVNDVAMFSRVTPRQKLRIVKQLQASKHVVAMTGDGDNDAPALSRADIGISMGIAGTDVARDASDMVLQDDDFGTIVQAVEEGRKVYQNIGNFVRYQISTNVAAVLLVIIATFIFKWPLPLTATQLLVINILMDGPPAVALGIEKRHGDVMERPPRPLDEPLPNGPDLLMIGFLGIVMVFGTLAIFSLAGGATPTEIPCTGKDPYLVADELFFESNGDCNVAYWDQYAEDRVYHARTIAFTTFCMFQLFNVVNCRSIDISAFKLGLFNNRAISISFAISLTMLLFIVQGSHRVIPLIGIPLGDLLATMPLATSTWPVIILLASSVFWIEEVRKLVFASYIRSR